MPEEPPSVLPVAALPDAPPVPDACPNCGAVRAGGDYCASCGQRRTPLRQPVRAFLGDAATEYFGLDGRLWRSLGLLLFHPGRLTRAYLDGRRTHYLRPLRLYLTATLLFFFLLSVLDPVGRVERALAGDAGAADSTVTVAERLAAVDATLARNEATLRAREQVVDALQARQDSLRPSGGGEGVRSDGEAYVARMDALEAAMADLGDLQGASARRREQRLRWQRGVLQGWPPDSVIHPADLDQASALLYGGEGRGEVVIGLPDWLPQSDAVQRMKDARSNAELGDAVASFLRSTIARLPTVMFLLLPVFALLLKGAYLRRGWYYSEHLVFALHTHAFAFLAFAVMAVLIGLGRGAAWTLMASQGLAFVIPVYFYVAQKRVYAQGWVKTGLKALLLGWVYFWLLVLFGLTLAFLLAAVWG